MSGRPFLLLVAFAGSVRNYAPRLNRIKKALPEKTELLFHFENDVAIAFVADQPPDSLSLKEPLGDAGMYLLVELGQQWDAGGFNVAYRWLREHVHDPTL